MTTTVLVAICGVALAGLLIGYVIGRYTGSGPEAPKTKEALEEYSQYKQQVNTHFQKTADLTQKLADDYRALYGHLSGGAVELCDEVEVKGIENGGLGKTTEMPKLPEQTQKESAPEQVDSESVENQQELKSAADENMLPPDVAVPRVVETVTRD